jgi:hypothetical protein
MCDMQAARCIAAAMLLIKTFIASMFCHRLSTVIEDTSVWRSACAALLGFQDQRLAADLKEHCHRRPLTSWRRFRGISGPDIVIDPIKMISEPAEV